MKRTSYIWVSVEGQRLQRQLSKHVSNSMRKEGYENTKEDDTKTVKNIAWMMTLYPLLSNRRQDKVRGLLGLWKTQPVMKAGRAASCHPERMRHAKELCSSCYMKQYHREAA